MEAKAILRNCGLSPRKMRLIADQIRGMKALPALNTLKFNQRINYAVFMDKLLKSAIANWEQKNEMKADEADLIISSIFVDGGVALKRLRTAPQGRAYRIKKRSCHITLFVDSSTAGKKVELQEEVTENTEA